MKHGELDVGKTAVVVAYCESGMRSRKAVEKIRKSTGMEAYSLMGGIKGLIKDGSMFDTVMGEFGNG